MPALGGEDFLVSAANETAVKLVASWPNWTNPICIITGPEGCGKTHLVNVWRARSGAAAFAAPAIKDAIACALAEPAPLAIEDIDDGRLDEHSAFHLVNLARERRFDILITGRTPPGSWDIALPDLALAPALGGLAADRGAGRCPLARGAGQTFRRPPACGEP